MKTIRYSLGLMLVVASLLLLGGCSVHYVDVYINDACFLVDVESDGVINPLLVFTGDQVIFNNLTDGEVEMTLPERMFSEENVTIAPYGRVILEVIQEDPSDTEIGFVITCTGGSGTPKVRVGDNP